MNSIELITLLVTIAVTPPPKPIAPFFVNGFREPLASLERLVW